MFGVKKDGKQKGVHVYEINNTPESAFFFAIPLFFKLR